LERAIKTLRAATAPIIIAGGGVHYSQATQALRRFAEAYSIPVSETQAGKSALPHDHALNMGAIGVTGTAAANALAENADVILAIGTRLQDFTTGSWALFNNPARVILSVNAGLRRRQARRDADGLRCTDRHRGTREGTTRMEGVATLDRSRS
jgi:3D-(3,5/4)-trihydroxycyclohexane-1,2-dione acylhydrolase (decyclizing)